MYLVETVKSVEAAEKLNTASVKHIKNKFNIMLQVNTSGETRTLQWRVLKSIQILIKKIFSF